MPSVRPYTRPWALFPRPDASVLWGANATFHHSSQWGVSLNRLSTGCTPSLNQSLLLTEPDPDIDVKSLRNTLQAVRETNRASLVVRKVDQAGRSTRLHKKPQFRYVKAETSADSQPELRQFFNHLSQHVQEKKRKRAVKKVAIPRVASVHHASGRDGFVEEIGTSHELTGLWRLNDGEQTIPTPDRLPWLAYLSEPHTWTSAVDRLSAEIRAFEQYVAPSEEEQLVSETALQDLIQTIKYADENLDVDVIGSRATGTADPLSDLDVNVSRPRTPTSMNKIQNPKQILDLIDRAFRGTHDKIKLGVRPIEVIYNLKTAKVPILLCRHKLSGLPIQIQCTPRTYDSTEYVKAFLKEYPTLRGLFKVLKQLLLMRGLTVGSHGGLTSYPLLNMIVASLKFSEGKFHPLDAGKQLLFFLDMYSEIDFSSQGISTHPLQYFPKRGGSKRKLPPTVAQDASLGESFPLELAGQRQMSNYGAKSAYLMTLQDPANPFNDVGRSAYLIKDVQATLISIRGKLNEALEEWDQSCLDSDSPQTSSRPQALLEPCIGADYRVYGQERADLKALGRQLLDSRNVRR
ncbi:hypothetical protein A1O3_05842 [Capronia epimyces CBS 606.96]|uniref:Poly(A) RNA polymerase mitochondrial-like central palm domain-containing protein n=1 Tax=Capronia epimyces CBS 606.96 TaxID=1182542 RepID=W9XX62_9EURO|nr:uncharacterized protein A1O3_05842 [Capronia epimyces CBS 606.96]EXJ85167.1 hypothetical protein A1O3_05842 [Capronia epimyces CBS 606.96]